MVLELALQLVLEVVTTPSHPVVEALHGLMHRRGRQDPQVFLEEAVLTQATVVSPVSGQVGRHLSRRLQTPTTAEHCRLSIGKMETVKAITLELFFPAP